MFIVTAHFSQGQEQKERSRKENVLKAVKMNNLILPRHLKCKGQIQSTFIQQVKNRLEMTKHNFWEC